MSIHYDILQLAGDNRRVITLVAPFAMDPKVLREMDGYPIITDENYQWFIAIQDKVVLAFAAIKRFKQRPHCLFTFDYTRPDHRRKGLQKKLMQERIKWCRENEVSLIKADCTAPCLPNYKAAGFKIVTKVTNWTKVELTL